MPASVVARSLCPGLLSTGVSSFSVVVIGVLELIAEKSTPSSEVVSGTTWEVMMSPLREVVDDSAVDFVPSKLLTVLVSTSFTDGSEVTTSI